MSAHGGGSGLRGTAGRWAACLGQRPPPPCAPSASVQQPSDARAPATCPPLAAGPPGHCPAHRHPEFAPHLCPGRWAGRQGQTPGILAGSRVAAVRGGPPAPPLCPGAPAGRALLPPGRPAVGQTLVSQAPRVLGAMAFAHWPSQESFTNTGDGHCRQNKSLRGHPQALGDPPGLPFSTASSALFWDHHGSQPGPGCDSTSQGWEPSGGRLFLKGSGDTCCHRGPLRGLVRTARCETTLSDGNSPPTRNTSSPPKVTHPQPPSTAPAAPDPGRPHGPTCSADPSKPSP